MSIQDIREIMFEMVYNPEIFEPELWAFCLEQIQLDLYGQN